MSFSSQNEIRIDTKLHNAALQGRWEEFERYADSLDPLVNAKQDTILHIHLGSKGNRRSTEFVRKVFDKCPQLLKKANENGDTPLHIAARNNRSEIARLLIQLAKTPTTGDLESGQDAAVEEARKMIRMVNKDGDTALHEAARWDNVDVVEEILEAEDLEYKYGVNNSGETPLYAAAHFRGFSSLHAMLKAYQHKPVAYHGPNGKTVLHAAIAFCHDESYIALEIIENMGFLVNEADENGWTPLHYAVCVPLFPYVMSKILEKDTSSAYMKDNDRKRTALHIAACLGNTSAIFGIVSMCSDCADLTDYRGWNVCHFASISKSSEALQLILRDPSLAHLNKCRDINGYYPIELLYFATDDTSNEWSNSNMLYAMHFRLKYEPREEISKKKEEIRELMKELGNGPFGKIVLEKSPEEKRKELEEEIIPQLEKAKDSHLVAAILVATVTFAAAFTLPGGYVSDEDKSNHLKLGSPILSRNAAFKAFVIADGIAMVLSTSSVFVHLIMVMLGYREKYYWLMRSAFWFLVIAMGAMVVAFVTGSYAALAPDSFGLAILICIIGLTFFLYVVYAVIRLVYTIASVHPIFPDGLYLCPRYLRCGWLVPLSYCCHCLILCPIYLLFFGLYLAFQKLLEFASKLSTKLKLHLFA